MWPYHSRLPSHHVKTCHYKTIVRQLWCEWCEFVGSVSLQNHHFKKTSSRDAKRGNPCDLKPEKCHLIQNCLFSLHDSYSSNEVAKCSPAKSIWSLSHSMFAGRTQIRHTNHGNKGRSPLLVRNIMGVSNYYSGDLRVKSSKHSVGTARKQWSMTLLGCQSHRVGHFD